jgi:hypothetical protein
VKKTALFAFLPLLAAGCSAQHTYDDRGEGMESGLIAEVFGDVGNLRGIDDQFEAEAPSDSIFDVTPSYGYVQRYDNELWANLTAEHPEGYVYLDVSVFNVDAMEPGRDYTVAVQDGYASEGEYAYTDTEAGAGDEPTVSVYACPESSTGIDVGSSSGNAEEVTVTKELTPSGERLVFSASADNESQSVFLDGWLTASPTDSMGY